MNVIEALLGLDGQWQLEFVAGLAIKSALISLALLGGDRLLRTAPAGAAFHVQIAGFALLALLPLAALSGAGPRLAVEPPVAMPWVDNAVPVGNGTWSRVLERFEAWGWIAAGSWTRADIRGPGWTAWLVPAWIAGVVAMLGRLAIGVIRVRRLLRDSQPAPAAVREAATRLAPELERRLDVRAGPAAYPFVFGWRRPVLLLPEGCERWDPMELRSVLAHEIHHVRRHDWPLRMGARCVAALYWFLPWVQRRVTRLELLGEFACDHEVVRLGVARRAYARHLLAGFERGQAPAGPAAAFAGSRCIEARIRSLLAAPPRGATRVRWALALLLLAVLSAGAAVRTGLRGCEHHVVESKGKS